MWKGKRGANFKRATEAIPEEVGEDDQDPTDRGSEEQAIVVMDSPMMGFHGQSTFESVPRQIQERSLELTRRSGKIFLWGRLLTG